MLATRALRKCLLRLPARMTPDQHEIMNESRDKRSYLDINQLVTRTGLSPATLWRLKRSGKIPYYQPGGKGSRVKFPEDAIEQILQLESPESAPYGNDKLPPQLPGPQPGWMSPQNNIQ